MEKIYYEFKKNLLSPNGRFALFFILISFLMFIYFFLEKSNKAIDFVLIIFGIVINFIMKPKKIIITDDELIIDKRKIEWNDIKKANFKTGLKDFTTQLIELHTIKNEIFIIRPRYFNDNTKLRNVIEKIVIEKEIIKYVEDRGL